jgi:NAD(P)-dependent dehydrogenase (short-subunit alcohol dehydrogenase family)
MDLGLAERVVIVSGGAKGIGAACSRMLVAEGARLVIADRDERSGTLLVEELAADRVRLVTGDLSDPSVCEQVIGEAVNAFGRIDSLVNNAGFNDAISLDHTPGEFLASLKLNLVPAFSLTHFAVSHLRESKGSVVNVGSKVALTGQGGTSGYAAAKGGINALTREWAAALAPDGVRVNAVLPAECDTDQYQRWLAGVDDPAGTRAAIENLVPLGHRMTTPEELAATIVFLLSPLSSHTTGQILCVDGGYTHLDRALSADHTKWD